MSRITGLCLIALMHLGGYSQSDAYFSEMAFGEDESDDRLWAHEDTKEWQEHHLAQCMYVKNI